jgi:hypothetical protein
MTARAHYIILEDSVNGAKPLLIQDIGLARVSITNDAEAVVHDLIQSGKLLRHQKLHYIDSAGHRDEILHKDGKFAGFAPIKSEG